MKKLTFLLVVSVLFVASPVMGAHDGRTLKHYCQMAILAVKNKTTSVNLLEDFNLCVSNINAVFSAIYELERFVSLKHPNAFSCVPDEIDPFEKITIIFSYLEKHPDKLKAKAVPIIMEAIVDAFPCPESQPQ